MRFTLLYVEVIYTDTRGGHGQGSFRPIVTGLPWGTQSKNGVGFFFFSCLLQREIAILAQYCLYKA